MAQWKRHFAGILNVEHAVSEDITNQLTDNAEGETSEITRDEVVKAMRRLKNGRSPGEDEVAAEMLKAAEKLLFSCSLTSYEKCGEQGGSQWSGRDQC